MLGSARRVLAAVPLSALLLGLPARADEEPPVPAEDRVVHRIVWDDAITPVTRTWFSESIERAEAAGAARSP
jgi:hypothetical protein